MSQPSPPPSIGRIVHYIPHSEETSLHGCSKGPHPAIVTEVREAECSLLVFFGGILGKGGSFAVARANRSNEPRGGSWFWPPRLP